MAGMWPLSFTQRHDLNGAPYPGAKAYFYDSETDDPITVYSGYSTAAAGGSEGTLPNPVEADGNGVFPGVFIGAETFYRFRVTTAAGVVLTDTITVPNLGPVGEGGDPVEPVSQTAIFKTGDLKHRFAEGIHDGWLPVNGRTMGSSSSGADYATDDNEALFLFLWTWDDSRVVGGEGASAAADWAANKKYTLPDMRGRTLVGLDDMDSSAASILTGLDVLGETTGSQTNTLVEANLAAHTHADGTLKAANHGHPYRASGSAATPGAGTAGGFSTEPNNTITLGPFTGTASSTSGEQIGGSGEVDVTGATGSTGSGTAFSIVQPVLAVSIYIKK